MIRVHRSGKKYEGYSPYNPSIKTRKSRRPSSSSSSSSSSAQAISSFPHDAGPAEKRLPPSQSQANTVTGSMTMKEQRPATVVKVPMPVYFSIQDALEIIKSSETNPSDKDQFNLDCAVIRIHKAASYHDDLPPEWKFDPATASTIVWQMMSDDEDDDDPISVEENPPVKFPNIYYVSLNAVQSKLWLEFKKFDEKTPTIHGLNLGRLEETASSIEVNHPYVQFIGAFAVDSFNKALEMLVKDKHNYLKLDEVITCKYHKMSSEYWFHMTIKATEEEHSAVYATKVQVFTNDGRITLCKFFEAPDGKGEKTIPLSPHYDVTLKVDGWSDPVTCYEATGLIRRTACKGYDFYCPWEIDRLWM